MGSCQYVSDGHHISFTKLHVPSEDDLRQIVKAETCIAHKIFAACDGQLTDQRAVFDRDSFGIFKWGKRNKVDTECVEVTTVIK